MVIKDYFNWQQLLIGSCNNKTEIQDWGIRRDVIKSHSVSFTFLTDLDIEAGTRFMWGFIIILLLIWTIWNIHHICSPQCSHLLPECVKQLYSSSKILIVQGHLQENKYIIWRHLYLFSTIFHCSFVSCDYLPGSQSIPSVSYYLSKNWLCKIRENNHIWLLRLLLKDY